jgi:cytochrome c-type biogenesis protein CcmH
MGNRTVQRSFTVLLKPLLWWAVLGALVPTLVLAQSTDDDVRRVARQLQCPVCEGQNVADSNSGLARDMRGVIKAKLQAGEPDQQILDGFVQGYGEAILIDPPKQGASLAVWVVPLVAVAGGLVALGPLLRGWAKRGRDAQPAATASPTDAAVLEDFRRFRAERGA